jgi:Flp pilus assembly protein TadD
VPLQVWLALLPLLTLSIVSAQSPAEQKIEQARKAIAANPKNADAHNALAFALTRRGRETSSHDWYAQAAESIEESLRLAPDNFEARKIETWNLLGRHKFARALEQARVLNKRVPDDVFVYALLTDACIETGEYAEAEKAAQWALDMRPGDIAALTRGAYLRELFGDLQGAIDLMQSAYNKTAPTEIEDRAWILCQYAHLELLRGAPDIAERALTEALQLFPGYHYALGNLVKVHTARQRYADAASAARDFYRASPHPENRFVLGQALARAGKTEEAREVLATFEKEAVNVAMGADNANRELAFYYADYAADPAQSLRFATLEMKVRHDLFTRHAYAWALQANGQFAEARREMDKVLAVGIRDPRIFYHAGIIAQRGGDRATARKYLEASLQLAAQSEVAALAQVALADKPQPH